ncbi:unnamed protein product [Musa acuminata subsp. malaccensis]|uniref:(wild Malaysian banana) hypothetical protein n=1 Tax=Musa acuminata subsp. malaccensis TaxID=214687 RepID=A0A8D7A441_MUSAM|nr:unnamed protein product [Musa acuminata subsp. malaccensis]
MYRHAPRLLTRVIGGGVRRSATARAFSTDLPAAPSEDAAFVEAWRKVAPNIDPPKTPLAFMKPRPPTPPPSPPSSPSTSSSPTNPRSPTRRLTWSLSQQLQGKWVFCLGMLPPLLSSSQGSFLYMKGVKSPSTLLAVVLLSYMVTQLQT